MELTSSALTAALVGVIVVLTKVIEWLMGRSNGNGKAKAGKEFNGHGEALTRVEAKLDMLASGMQEMRQGRALMVEHMASLASGQERIIERLGDVVGSVERLADRIGELRNEKHR